MARQPGQPPVQEDEGFEDPQGDDEEESEEEEEPQLEGETPAFALNPGSAVGSGLLDYTNKACTNHYNKATTSLFSNEDNKFDLSLSKVQNFMERLRDRERKYDISVLEVPATMADVTKPIIQAKTVHFCDHHGEVSLRVLHAFAETYVGVACRAAQDDEILLQCLNASITEDAYNTLNADASQFTIRKAKCGLLMLKVMLQETAIDVSVAPDLVRKELSNAKVKFLELKCDVREFNKWINLKMTQLTQRGETSTDVRTHVIEAYKTSSQPDFVNYITQLTDKMRDEEEFDPTYKQVMEKAKNKFDQIESDKIYGEAGGTPPQSEQLLALEARLAEQAKQLKKLSKNRGGGKGGQGNGRGKKKGNSKKERKPFPKELKTAGPPAEADIEKPKKISGEEYFYCKNHEKWGRHKTSECHGKGWKPSGSKKSNNNNNSNRSRQVRAAQAQIQDDDSDHG